MFKYGGNDESEISREELELVLRETVAGIAMVTPHPDGVKLLYTNDSFFSIFGYTRDEYENLSAEVRFSLFNYNDFMNIIAKVNTDYAPGEIQQFECRVNRKNNEEAWVLFSTRKPRFSKPGDQTFICNMVDITEMKRLQMQIQEEKERYDIVQELTDDILFSYDVIADSLECSPKILRALRNSAHTDDAIEKITYGDVLDHRDVPLFIEALSNGLSGKRINIFDARIINQRGDGVWNRIKFAVTYDKDGNAQKFIGTITDIDKEKKEKSRLIAQAETDQLTGYLNKISTCLKVNEVIRSYASEPAAMFLVDIDDFKKLNDTYGHHAGDVFLKEFTEKMALVFRSTDILGRVGGEEFVMFVSGLGDLKERVADKAREVEEACHQVRVEGDADVVISCSIGISVYPEDGMSYSELFGKADKAMYQVKGKGKNGYAFFE